MNNLPAYRKTIAAILGAISTWGITAVAENGIEPVEWFGLIGALAAVTAVFSVPNEPAPPVKRVPRKAAAKKQAGHTDIGGLLVVAAVAIVVWFVLAFAFDLIG